MHANVREDPARLLERSIHHDDVLIIFEACQPRRGYARTLPLGRDRVERDQPNIDAAQALACLVDEFERTGFSVVQPHVANRRAKGMRCGRLVLDDVRLRAGQLAAYRQSRVTHHGDDDAR